MKQKFLKVVSIVMFACAAVARFVGTAMLSLALLIFIDGAIQEGAIPNLVGTHAGMVLFLMLMFSIGALAVAGCCVWCGICGLKQKNLKRCIVLGLIFWTASWALLATSELRTTIFLPALAVFSLYSVASIVAYAKQRSAQKSQQQAEVQKDNNLQSN